MPLLRVVLSFALLPRLEALQLLDISSYSAFRMYEVPTVETLVALMDEAKQPFIIVTGTKSSQLSNLEAEHKMRSSEACRTFTESVLEQWPSEELDMRILATIDDTLVDRRDALQLVLPEWI
jgi:hypothetical protein